MFWERFLSSLGHIIYRKVAVKKYILKLNNFTDSSLLVILSKWLLYLGVDNEKKNVYFFTTNAFFSKYFDLQLVESMNVEFIDRDFPV